MRSTRHTRRPDCAAQGIEFGLVRIKRDLYDPLKRSGMVELIGEDMLFPTLPVAEQAYLRWAAEHPMEPVNPNPVDEDEQVIDALHQAWTGSSDRVAPPEAVEAAAQGDDPRLAAAPEPAKDGV